MKLQKLAVFVFLSLPLLMRAQPAISGSVPSFTYYDSCTPADREEMDRIEARIRPFDAVELGPPTLPSGVILCIDRYGGWAGFDGTFAVAHVSLVGTDEHRKLYIHERTHHFLSKGGKTSVLEGATEYATWARLKSAGFQDTTPLLALQASRAGTLELSRLGSTSVLDYGQALVTFAILGAANATGPANNWPSDGTVREIWQALRELDFQQGWDPQWRIAQIRAIAQKFPRPVDGQSAEVWLRQQRIHQAWAIFKGEPFVEVATFSGDFRRSGMTAVNPEYFQLIRVELKDGFWETYLDDQRVMVLVRIRDHSGQVVFSKPYLTGQIYLLPFDLATGAYTLEAWTEDGKRILHQNHFVRWPSDADSLMTILKTDAQSQIREFPITIGNARVLHNGQGFAVVEPNCKDVRPCDVTVQGQTLEQFTWFPSRVVRLNSRRPVFNLPQTVTLIRGQSAAINVRQVVGTAPASWSLKALGPGITLNQWSGEGHGTVRVAADASYEPSALLEFQAQDSFDAQYVEVRILGSPPRRR